MTNLFYVLAKRGKTLFLLKESSKPIPKKKNRKIFPLLGSIKDYHNSQPTVSQMAS